MIQYGHPEGPARGTLSLFRAALIVVDMQNGFCSPGGYFQRCGHDVAPATAAIPAIVRLRSAFRETGRPVFLVRYALRPDYADAGLLRDFDPGITALGGLVAGSWDAEIVDELAPAAGDEVIDKTRYSAFHATRLEQRLRELKVDAVVVCGVTTNVCVETTVRDAFVRDLRVAVVSDASAEPSPARHESALRAMAACFAVVVTTADVERALHEERA